MHADIYHQLKHHLIDQLSGVAGFEQLSRPEKELRVHQLFDESCRQLKVILTQNERDATITQLLNEVVWGLRQIQEFQDDPDVEEIMVNGYHSVFIKRRSQDHHTLTAIKIAPDQMASIIEKLLEGTGRRVDRSTPLVDLRMADGSRVNIISQPLSIIGPCITIRKFPEDMITLSDMVERGSMNQAIADFLTQLVELKANLVISGGTASGKTTLLSAITSAIKGGEAGDRVITIEETAEIKLSPHIINQIRLETRPANLDGVGEYNIRDLVKNALRMRPDRIIVGEARGQEAFDLLQAMNTGHPGSFTTLHANSVADALHRFESLVLMAGLKDVPLSIIRGWITQAIHVIVQLGRNQAGKRVIKEVAFIDQTGQPIPCVSFQHGKWTVHRPAMQQVIKQLNAQL